MDFSALEEKPKPSKPHLLRFRCAGCSVWWGPSYGRDLWAQANIDIGKAGWRLIQHKGRYALFCSEDCWINSITTTA